ncbi:MAG: ACP S-malonyltransferase [Elainellaceae cyanobacterium]
MSKTAWVFPGQGSQEVGMGQGLFESSETASRLQQARDILGWSVTEVCQSPDDKVSNTLYTQPCLYVVETLLVDQLKQRGGPDLLAGHSLGEYTALYAAGVFDFEAGLRLVQRRAELMSQASEGLMAAVIGFDSEQLHQLIGQTEGVVLANDNSAAQAVISGTSEAVDAVLERLKAKRKVKLNVSGAFHSPLMAAAAADFEAMLTSVPFQEAEVPVLSNVDPTPAIAPTILKDRLIRQMTGSVRWREIALNLEAAGVQRIVEVGPGKVLTGLMKRTCPQIELQNVSRAADLG